MCTLLRQHRKSGLQDPEQLFTSINGLSLQMYYLLAIVATVIRYQHLKRLLHLAQHRLQMVTFLTSLRQLFSQAYY
jgi:hypothetical protein